MLKPLDENTGYGLGRRQIFPLDACDVGFSDGGRQLLDQVSLTLNQGQKTVIMGANGAGKSLLMRVLHGLVKPEVGAVLWAGVPADAEVMSRQAMVFQKPSLLRRSAEGNIRFVLGHLHRSEAESRTRDILERARLSAIAHTPARLLSGGEQQRLAIARALALEPDILFLDEPCASLDPASTIAVEELIETAHQTGTKIVLVTHDIGQARRLADEVVFMSGGRIAEHTAASQFFGGPVSAAARDYLAGRLHVPRHSTGT